MAFPSVDHGKVLRRKAQTEPGRVSTGGSENGRLGLER